MTQQLQPLIAAHMDVTPGEGEMERRVRELDWSRTPLGPRERWPLGLRAAVDICLRSRFPMDVLWGPDFLQIYNDAYRPILGAAKHPRALGQAVRECWAEIWDVVGPMLEEVRSTGRACWHEDLHLAMQRFGFDEETYFTFSYSPIDDGGTVGGIFVAVRETTAEVLGRRRQAILHELAVRTADVSTIDEACEAIGAVLRAAPLDLPFAALYLADPARGSVRLRMREGVVEGLPDRAPGDVADGSPLGGALADVLRGRDAVLRSGIPAGPSGAPHAAVLLPVRLPGRDQVTGALVLGTSPRLALNASYREFLDIVAGHVAAVLGRVRAHEEERQRIAAQAALAEHERAEAALRRQALVFETVSEAVIVTDPDGRVQDCNPAAARIAGRSRDELIGRRIDRMDPPDLLGRFERHYLEHAARTGVWAGEVAFVGPDGDPRFADATVVPQRDASGQPVAYIRVARDVTERRLAEQWAEGQRRLLELIATGRPLAVVLEALARLIESQLPDAACSILTCEGGRLWHGAAPSLPAEFVRGIQGLEIGPAAGACGTAAFHKHPVFVADVATDPLWANYRGLALAHGIRSAWSAPILGTGGSVLGTFALYRRRPHLPTDRERLLIDEATHVAGIAIARHQAEQVLRRQAVVFETLSEAVLLGDPDGRVTGWNPAMEALTGYTREEVLGREPRMTYTPELRETLTEEVLSAVRRDGVWTAEVPFVRKDGSIRLGEVKVVADRDREGRLSGVVGIARDVTDRRRAEDALRRSNEQLAAIVQMQQDVAMAELDVGAVMRRIAEGARQLTGADGALVGEIDGEELVLAVVNGLYERHRGVRFPLAISLAGRCLDTGVVARVDDARSDPRVHPAMPDFGARSLIVVPLIYKQQRLGVLAVGSGRAGAFGEHDEQALTVTAGLLAAGLAHAMAFEAKRRLVAERTAAVAALEQSEERLRALSECSPDGIFVADVDGRCTYVNRRMAEIVGAPPESFLGEGWQRHLHPEDREAFVREWAAATAAGRAVSQEFRFVTVEGDPIVIHVRSAPLTLGDGRIVGFVGTCQDITERKHAEEALRRAERQYRELVESVDAVVWRAAGDPPRLTFVSQQVEALFGDRPESMLGIPVVWAERLHPDDLPLVRAHVAAAQRPNVAVQYECRARTADGRELWLRSMVRHMQDGTEPGELIGLTFDVTELRRAREELDHSRQQLREFAAQLQTIRERERAHIAREIHDQLGQSLTGLKMELAWLRTKLPRRAVHLAESTDQMMAQVDGTIETVRRLASELHPHVLDTLGLVAALEWQVREFERRTKIRCTLQAAEERVEPDPERSTAVFRIVQEALTNAARHGRASVVDVTVGVEAEGLVVTVRDDGCGMPTDAGRATGSLGILGMRERAIACGGELSITSAPDAGTTVVVRVPLGAPALASRGDAA